MRLVSIVTSFIFAVFIMSWIWFNYPEARIYTYELLSRKKFNTLEASNQDLQLTVFRDICCFFIFDHKRVIGRQTKNRNAFKFCGINYCIK